MSPGRKGNLETAVSQKPSLTSAVSFLPLSSSPGALPSQTFDQTRCQGICSMATWVWNPAPPPLLSDKKGCRRWRPGPGGRLAQEGGGSIVADLQPPWFSRGRELTPALLFSSPASMLWPQQGFCFLDYISPTTGHVAPLALLCILPDVGLCGRCCSLVSSVLVLCVGLQSSIIIFR